jgi:tetratricopeptide (TPR) repeat protein
MNARFRFVIAFLSAGALLLTARGAAFAREGDATRNSGTEPRVSQKEARLLQEVTELANADRPAAIEKLRGAVDEKSSAALDFALGAFLFQEGKLAEAEDAYAAAAKKLPRFARAWADLGRVRLMRDRPSEAAQAFREALSCISGHDSSKADLWKLLGYSYLVSDRLLAAESAYRRALVLAPDDREVSLGLAKTLLAAERSAEALPLLRSLSASDPLKGELWLLQANAYLMIEDHDRALEALECAHRLGVLKPEARLTLADLYFNKGLFDSAVRHYDLAFRTEKISAERMLRCAEALFQVGRAEVALRYLAHAQARGPKQPARGHLLAGRIAEAKEDLAAARKAFEKASEADPLNGEALLALGELHWRTKDYERAAITLERASRVRGFEARALVTLAQMEVELDRFEQATEHLEAAQELKPSPRVGRYLEQVRRLAKSVGAP